MDNIVDEADESKMLSKSEIFSVVIVLILAFFFFMAMQFAGHNESIRNGRMSSLEDTSRAHAFIVSNYRACIGGRGQTHVTCVGSIAKTAEIKGFEIDQIRKVFIEIEAVMADNIKK
jgi:hypothetical protein